MVAGALPGSARPQLGLSNVHRTREPAISQPFLRGLSIVEAVGSHPSTISELARMLDLDKAVVSRLVASAEGEGWLLRHNGIVVLGPRAAALGRDSPERSFVRAATELCHTVAGVTGLDAAVNQFGGDRGHVLAHSPGRYPIGLGEVEFGPESLFLSAVGQSVAAQLDAETVEVVRSRLAKAGPEESRFGRDAVEAVLAPIRAGEPAREQGNFVEGLGCIAMPWRHPLAVAPTAFSVIGPVEDVLASTTLIEGVLAAATAPAATSATIIAAAARIGG
jgi:DNA-binding IclR family transcriptional regulator